MDSGRARAIHLSQVVHTPTLERAWWFASRILLGVSLVFAALQVWQIARDPTAYDLGLFREAGRRVFTGGLYDETATYAYRWSPVLAYVLGPLTAFGPWPWRILQLALAATMPSRRLSVIVLLSYPLWFDVWLGNVNVLVLWLAAWGFGGRRWAIAGYLALAVLIPRPLVIPLAAWFLYREPWTRVPFAIMFGAHALAVAATGWGPAWVGRLVASGSEMGSPFNYGPSRIIGAAWLPIGLALGAVAWWRGKPALAGLLVSPYWLPYYFLLPLAELAPRSPRETLFTPAGTPRSGS